MKNNKFIYIVVAILIIIILILLGIILNIKNQEVIDKQEDVTTSQLTETSSSNSYITTQEHLTELGKASSSITTSFDLNAFDCYIELATNKNYKKLSINCIPGPKDYNSNWSAADLAIYGDGTVIGYISDTSTHEYDISQYDTLKIMCRYKSGASAYGEVSGSYTIE
jgi:hypothetical protein